MAYTPTYTKPYEDGWKNLPEETTPVTAEALNGIDNAIESIESQLEKTTTIYDETAISNGRTADTTVGKNSIAYGNNVKATGDYSQAFGNGTTASANYAVAMGTGSSASGIAAIAQGDYAKASGQGAHAENAASATGKYSHAENAASATGTYSHAEGNASKAFGTGSHAEGQATQASSAANYSHTEGYYTVASSPYQHVQGKFNVSDTEDKYAHIVGGGSSSSDRKNIHTLDWQGNAEFSGDVTDGNGDSIASVKGEIPSEEILDIDFSTYFS